ncbi:MAG: TRAP transporter large permease subunit [Nitratireductor sp.]
MLILMQLSFLLMGTFLDDTAMLVIVAPLSMCRWSNCLVSISYGTAFCIRSFARSPTTPPFGYNLFLMRAMAPPDIKLRDIYLSVIPFVIVMIVTLVIVMLFPELALWLPSHFQGKLQG